MARKMQPFPWYGGKYRMFDFLLKHMPQDTHHFVDVFGGSGVVLLNRPKCAMNTYNDIDGDLVNFFQVLRDDGDALIRALQFTPYSRKEFALAISKKNDASLTNLERARIFYCRAMFVFAGKPQNAGASSFSCSVAIDSRRGGMTSDVKKYLGHIEKLTDIVIGLRGVQIENLPALDILRRYDRESTFFYCDPPYVHTTRMSGATKIYAGEMGDAEHTEIATVLSSIKGKAMVSGYRSDLYDKLFSDWRRVDEGPKYSTCAQADRRECIWMNYSTQEGGDLI